MGFGDDFLVGTPREKKPIEPEIVYADPPGSLLIVGEGLGAIIAEPITQPDEPKRRARRRKPSVRSPRADAEGNAVCQTVASDQGESPT